MTLKRWITVSAAALSLAVFATGCAAPDTEGSDPAASSSATAATASPASDQSPEISEENAEEPAGETAAEEPAAAGSALAALETLDVKGRAPQTGYEREQFGAAWADTDHNGCDTRNDILARDLEGETFRPGTHDCIVLTGVLDDPYTATEIHFQRGQDTSTKVQIDHVVALSDAWQKGAQQLSVEDRTQFANDPLNLLAVDGPANSQKGAGDAATWLPANRSFRCDYVSRQIAVKARYDLWVTSAEKDAMSRVLSNCPDHELPTGGTDYQVDITATQEAAPVEEPAPIEAEIPVAPAQQAPVEQAPAQGGTDPQFSSCAKAKDAGYGPYVSGVDPEYGWYRDGDNDGINCE